MMRHGFPMALMFIACGVIAMMVWAPVSSSADGQSAATASGGGPEATAVVDANGNLAVPANYRTAYQFLGSWTVASGGSPGAKQLHFVYASPGAVAAYRAAGGFPDGAVLVKEVFQGVTRQMTTGTVSGVGTLAGWFVMVKDGKGRYVGNKLWGDGWGWSWFDAADPTKTTSTDYRTNCKGCHIPARKSDWIYVEGYPPLRK
jgi:Cytochrome P460